MGICIACEHHLSCEKETTKSVALETTKSSYTSDKFQSSSEIETSVHIHHAPDIIHYDTNNVHKVSITSVIHSNQISKSNGPIIKHLRQKSSNKLLNFSIKVQ